MYGYIYLTTNLVNNKKYVGQHKSSKFTTDYKGSGKIIKQAFSKYGWDNFKVELLEECSSSEELNLAEKSWISKLNAAKSNEFYNICYGGSQNPVHPLSPSEIDQRRLQMKERWKSEDCRDRMSKMLKEKQSDGKSWMIGRKHSEETKQKMSESRQGSKHPMYGKHHTEESRKKMSEAKKNSDCKISDYYSSKGKIWVHKENQSKLIFPEEFTKYELEGFIKGRPYVKHKK